MKVLYFLFLISLLSLSCKSDKKNQTTTAQAKQTKTTTTTPSAAVASKPGYPILPKEWVMKIWNEGEMIDYLFHNLPFSMSQDEQASIQTNLTYLGEEPVDRIPNNCKPMARQFYQVGGDIVMEADIYYTQDCMFFVFLIDGKEQYSNQMNASGQQFFANIIQQAMKARQGIGQPQ